MNATQRALPLIERIYAASSEPAVWAEFAQDLSKDFGGAPVSLMVHLPGETPPVRFHRVGFLEGYGEIFEKHLARGTPWGEWQLPEYQLGFVSLAEMLSTEAIQKTSFYREYMQPQGFAPEGPVIHMIPSKRGLSMYSIAVFRREGARAFDELDMEVAQLLVPHLARAVAIQESAVGSRRGQLALAEVIDRMPTGVILIDSHRQPLITNRSADRILSLNDGFSIDKTGPCAASQQEDRKLRAMLDSATAPQTVPALAAGGFLAVSRPSERRPFPVMVTPLLGQPDGGSADDAAAVIFISNPDWSGISTAQVLQSLYSLTAAEAELVRLLAEGKSLDEAAEHRGVTMNTARSQLKHVFAKTDTRRQGELVQIVLAGVAAFSEE